MGVTINTSGVNISGVATAGIVSATTLYGDGTNLTGIALTIAPLNYNPAILSSGKATTVGIGLTFNQAVKAGSGNVTLRIAGAAGTVVENFGVGSSVTISDNSLSFTPTSDLDENVTYFVDIPSSSITNMAGDSYVGTGYTFQTTYTLKDMWTVGQNLSGSLGLNQNPSTKYGYSSPVQIPGDWTLLNNARTSFAGGSDMKIIKSDGTLSVSYTHLTLPTKA